MRGAATRAVLAAVLALCAASAGAISVSNRYRSPRNPERKVRATTELIVLHTTEAPARSSLNKVSERGECHYCVTEQGDIYRIVDRDREAFHAGRSMWRGREDVDKYSVGIECVGYHDKPMPAVQLDAIKTLVKELQRMYRIPDYCVVAHSHVAYGAPNKWHPKKHRGRKRCGMLFAMASVRERLGLASKPSQDVDVKARRLVQADPHLQKVLYGNVDTMRGKMAAPGASGGGLLGWLKRKPADAPEAKPKVTVSAKPPAKPKKAASSAGKNAKPPGSVAELKARGFAQLGVVSAKKSASQIAGGKWNAPDTYYTIRDKVIAGNKVNPARIEKGMAVWRRR